MGIATLKLLADLPFSILKIDRSITRRGGPDQPRGVICRTMIELARTLHLECIAEGVETEAQRQTFARAGLCDGPRLSVGGPAVCHRVSRARAGGAISTNAAGPFSFSLNPDKSSFLPRKVTRAK